IILGVHNGSLKRVAGKRDKAMSEQHPLPKSHIVVVERPKTTIVMGVAVIGDQVRHLNRPMRIPITGPRLQVGGVEWARPKPKGMGRTAGQVRPWGDEKVWIYFLEERSRCPSVNRLEKSLWSPTTGCAAPRQHQPPQRGTCQSVAHHQSRRARAH